MRKALAADGAGEERIATVLESLDTGVSADGETLGLAPTDQDDEDQWGHR